MRKEEALLYQAIQEFAFDMAVRYHEDAAVQMFLGLAIYNMVVNYGEEVSAQDIKLVQKKTGKTPEMLKRMFYEYFDNLLMENVPPRTEKESQLIEYLNLIKLDETKRRELLDRILNY